LLARVPQTASGGCTRICSDMASLIEQPTKAPIGIDVDF
jgi:hypothetical protein